MDYIYVFFLNLTRFVAVSTVTVTWAIISINSDSIETVPWTVVISLAALYGDKGISVAKSLKGDANAEIQSK